ncbi:ribbon-helix-helix domain-containing protein [Shimia thalassica]|uniref:ribbon-helix-helix domain-containing protein n=1 Tax=Shimia thalassica TaxID=1715693 RepID=UPI001C09888F|nr:ribbon-helix-helix domain-containing protein [Shimia thalassica]MBU2944903.1 ribbon-helix-helix domain-containing protein [Shimia thalassica]MDO6504791.1 ribbon-helix-helix domain-containing protein [Shimia thalassica]
MPPPRTDKKATRVHILLDEDELSEIDDFFHEARLKNRSEAIRTLISYGLDVHRARLPFGKEKPEPM